MEGLKVASDAVRKATDSLVRSAQNTVQKPTSPRVKVDRFKQVMQRAKSGFNNKYFLFQRIEAEARVIRLEKELEEAKAKHKEIQDKSQRTVNDIKQEREAEHEVISLSKELDEARKFCLRLNEEEYK